jgi:hypothetical protein
MVSSRIWQRSGRDAENVGIKWSLSHIDNLGYLVVDDETNEMCEKTIDQLDPFGGQFVDSSHHGST